MDISRFREIQASDIGAHLGLSSDNYKGYKRGAQENLLREFGNAISFVGHAFRHDIKGFDLFRGFKP